MQLLIVFDCDADIIEVPQSIIDERDVLSRRFWKWLSNKSNKHQYWTTFKDSSGKQWTGLRYRGDAFVEWLNKKVLKNTNEKSYVLHMHVDINDYEKELPSIYF